MVVISIEELKEKGAFEVEEFRECIESCKRYIIDGCDRVSGEKNES